MNLVIVAPSPYRFVMGGAEHFWLGLQQYINGATRHLCELIKLPTREGSVAELVDAYRRHAALDVLGFDRVLTSKYPAWMVCHPQHALYMLHPLRGLYDHYHLSGLPTEPAWPAALEGLRQAIALLRHAPAGGGNAAALQLLDHVEAALDHGDLDPAFARFPGPFARWLVQALDRFALQPARICSYTALSHTVARRRGYFPDGVECAVVHPPPRLDGFRCGGDEHLFTVSRLDAGKRIDLLIAAMRLVEADIPLLIGGTGPDEERLRALAAPDPRVRFLGPLTDRELLDTYADALAVPFVPYEEDYGLVTIEAMRSGKPVITVTDAGGVNEFVSHGETGLCVPPDPAALAVAIDSLCRDRGAARAMGRAARLRVRGIGWRPLAERLLGQPLAAASVSLPARAAPRGRPRMVVAVTFAVYPPQGGGESRSYHLYRSLAAAFDVTLVCLCDVAEQERETQLGPGCREWRVPKSARHHAVEYEASMSLGGVPVTDIIAARDIALTPRFLARLDEACADADVMVACHPFLAPLLLDRCPDLPLWLEAQDVELVLKRSLLPEGAAAAALLAEVERAERLAWRRAQAVFACVEHDLAKLRRLYGPTQAQTFEVPNGFAEDTVRWVSGPERAAAKEALGLGAAPLVLFIGSWHGPNLEAIERILGYADALPGVTFALLGSGGLALQGRVLPANLHVLGRVDDELKQLFLGAADLALNPMSSGSGSNLKMLDYFAAGVPVLSTLFGVRGLDFQPQQHFVASTLDAFLPTLVRCLLEPGLTAGMAERAHARAHAGYGWRAIGARALERLLRLLPPS